MIDEKLVEDNAKLRDENAVLKNKVEKLEKDASLNFIWNAILAVVFVVGSIPIYSILEDILKALGIG